LNGYGGAYGPYGGYNNDDAPGTGYGVGSAGNDDAPGTGYGVGM